MEVLCTEEVSVAYGDHPALHRITVALQPGEVVAVCGPNGSGKSTLLKTMAGLIKPRTGRVLLAGKNLSEYPRRAVARKVGLVPQDTALAYNFTVEELVAMGREPHRRRLQPLTPEDRRTIAEAMAWVSLESLRERRVTTLSGGERQRAVIARALAQEPRVVLLDEPTAHLDISHQGELMEILVRLAKERGLAVGVVLHDLNLASAYADRIILLCNGTLLADGPAEKVITAETLREGYGVDGIIRPHPLTGKPQVLFFSGLTPKTLKRHRDVRVHVIAGGGSGAIFLEYLTGQGFAVSAGVLNEGDSDWLTGKRLGIPMVEEKPFSPISDESLAQHQAMIEQAQAVVLAPIPLGWGNLKNITAAQWALERGIPIIVVEEEKKVESRDFTGGQGTAMYRQLLQAGAIVSRGREDLIHLLEKATGG